jgi:hypothetical protein
MSFKVGRLQLFRVLGTIAPLESSDEACRIPDLHRGERAVVHNLCNETLTITGAQHMIGGARKRWEVA